MIYYTIVTITTTGYGDISPTTETGYVIFIVFIISLLVVLPVRVQELQKMSSLTSGFGRAYYRNDKNK